MADSPPEGPPDELLPEESAEELYEHAPCGYLTATSDLVVVRANARLLSWLGLPRDAVVRKKRLGDLFTAGGRVFLETHVAPLLQMQGEVDEIALEIVREGAPPLAILMSAALVRAPGRPPMVRATLFNVTDRRSYERELLVARRKAEAAAQVKAEFVSMISHEIRTPLSAIIGVAHLLNKTELTPHQQKLASVLRSSGDNLLTLINDILDFSKIEAGKVTLEERPIELAALVEGVRTTLALKADEKSITLETKVDEAVPNTVIGDPVKLRQVLVNLMSNAIKFTAKGSVTLDVRLEAPGPAPIVRFEVRDTGIGIAADRIGKIFDDFTQASYDISVKYGGTGLGLAITKKLIEVHGSEIHVESTSGVGSRFWFSLRFKSTDAASTVAPRDDEVQAARLRGMRVLLVDDNEVNRFVLGGFLERWGIVYDVAENGRLALEKVAHATYDVVLMDLQMPELSGYDATRAIRRMEEAGRPRVPIIAVSASMRMGDPQDLAQAGFDDFVGKPVSPDLLAEKLAAHRPQRSC